jgi:hypothetical protein
MSIETWHKEFPDVNPHIVLKTDLLRRGIDITKAAVEGFQQRDDLLWKDHHLFSYDRQETKVYGDKIPYSFHLDDGCNIQVRTNRLAPYSLDLVDGEFVIRERESNYIIARNIWFERKPRWYDMRTKDGIPMPAIAQGQSRMMYVFLNRYCELFKTHDECLFCNLNGTPAHRKKGGDDVVADMNPEQIAEGIQTALHTDNHYSWLYLSGGTIIKKYRGQTELDFYCTRLNAIREKLQVWVPATFQIAAYNDEGWKRIHNTGIPSIQTNIEVWDKKLFKWICPGKERFVGYNEWIKRTIRAVDLWGPGRVNPNFVIGAEMAKPYGFEDVSSAVESTAGGWDFLMSHGVLPRYNTWCPEPDTGFVRQEQPVPPLKYFIEVQKAYMELRHKYNFDPPFPAAVSFVSFPNDCLNDFEFYHGTGPLSKKYLDDRLGVKLGELGGRFDQEGYTL